MSPFGFAVSAVAATQILAATHLWGIPDLPAGILMISGLIFLIGILPLLLLCALVFECGGGGDESENDQA